MANRASGSAAVAALGRSARKAGPKAQGASGPHGDEVAILHPGEEAARARTSTPPGTPAPDALEAARRAIAQVVHGNLDAVDALFVALAAGGHVLLDGIPGVGKTTVARTFALVTGLDFQRIQLTPDLLPADITGHYFFDQATQTFELREGPIMAQVVLADEINRTPPRTQAALLEAMQERQVTIEGKTLQLPRPFLLVATKNPVDLEGVYSLPGAELDRFMLSVRLDYPERAIEAGMLMSTLAAPTLPPAVPKLAAALQAAFHGTRVHADLVSYILDIVAATRKHEDVLLGASPRAGRHLLEASRGRAAIRGRTYVTPDDIKDVAVAVLRHRLVLRPEADLAGRTADALVRDLLEQITVPIGRPA